MDNVKGNNRPGPYEIVIGSQVASEVLFVNPGDPVRIIAPHFAQTAMGSMPLTRDAIVTGIFTTGFPEYDGMYGYISMEGAQNLFMAPEGQVDGLRVMVEDPNEVEAVSTKLQEMLGEGILVTTWQTRNKALFDALVLEKWAMFIILLLIVLVAAFNIIGTLTMVVTDKTREIGILKSMGATEGAILRVFRNQGLFIGGIGTALGTLGGLLTCYILANHVRIPELQSAYMSDSIPVEIDPLMVILIVFCAMLICLLASLYPARQAAKLDPVEALRYE
jgi:lipoprotein-releasing system permease protein